jgi:hypothetical protein
MTATIAVDIISDLNYLDKGIQDLEEYLLSTELYWNLPGLSSLTVGGLLLTKARLQGIGLQDENLAQFKELEGNLAALAWKWRVAWENKISPRDWLQIYIMEELSDRLLERTRRTQRSICPGRTLARNFAIIDR